MFGIRVSGLGERWFTAPVKHCARSVFSPASRRSRRTRISAIAVPKPLVSEVQQ
ncbi:hypothetical protein ACLK1T_04400 [Escherichia coli]